MDNFLLFKHSFNAGDLITVLPGIQKLYKETGCKAIIYQRLNLPANYSHNDNHPIKSEDGKQVCMNREMFEKLKPLIEVQEYVEKFQIWEGQKVDFDFDLTRKDSQMPLPGGDIHHWPFLIFPQLECDLSIPWMVIDKRQCDFIADQSVLINFTERYRNPYITYHFLKGYEKKLLFSGTEREYDLFCKDNNLDFPKFISSNFLELAQVIASCKLFLGNQSMCWHIADAMKVPRILEVCTAFPNSFPTGKDGYAFINQGSLEHNFNKLINQ